VTRTKDLDRKNQVRITITEKGNEAFYMATKREAIHHIFSILNLEEREQLISSLAKLSDRALEELGANSGSRVRDLIQPS